MELIGRFHGNRMGPFKVMLRTVGLVQFLKRSDCGLEASQAIQMDVKAPRAFWEGIKVVVLESLCEGVLERPHGALT